MASTRVFPSRAAPSLLTASVTSSSRSRASTSASITRTIPVVANNSKKFADIPLTFKIKSGLSFRRALKLVDDVMAKKGRSKGDAPEEE